MLPTDKLNHRLVPIVAEFLAVVQGIDPTEYKDPRDFANYLGGLYRYYDSFQARVDKQVGRIIETVRELEQEEGGE